MMHLMFNLLNQVNRARAYRWFAAVFFFTAIFAYSITGFMYFEVQGKPDLTWVDAMWWSFVTMTTVGYGDYYPESTLGRMLVGLPTMILGVSMLGYVLSVLATGIMESKMKELRGLATMKFTDHIIICHFISVDSMLDLLHELSRDVATQDRRVVLIDERLEEIPVELRDKKMSFVRGDPSRLPILEQAGLYTCTYVLIQVDEKDLDHSDSKNLTVALTIERVCPGVHTIVQCVNPENAVFFERANVDSVVCLSSLSSQLMVQELQDPGINTVLRDLTSNIAGKQFYIVDAPSEIQRWNDLRQHFEDQNILLIGLRRGQENVLTNSADDAIESGDLAIVIAANRPTD